MAFKMPLAAFCSTREPIVVTKEMLKSVTVIGQVDSKFIATVCEHDNKRCLLIFDQHAVDERVRLERLQTNYKQDLSEIKRTILTSPLLVTICDEEMGDPLQIQLKELENGLLSSGICCSIVPKSKMLIITITEIPMPLLRKILHVNSHAECVRYVQEAVRKIVVNHLKDKGRPSYGSLVNHLLAAEACARAIKFGDRLSNATMTSMLSQLAKCDLPFQCAHGRPTLTVINYDLSGRSYEKVRDATFKQDATKVKFSNLPSPD